MKAEPAPERPTERQACLILNALPGVGPVALHRLRATLGGGFQEVLCGPASRREGVPGLRPAGAAAIARWREHLDLAAEEARLAGSGSEFLAWNDPGYPGRLREIADPPLGLYRRGPADLGRRGVAIVGTRRPTQYGRTVARELAAALVAHDLTVVSGLAQGIDTAAHEGALAAGGATWAVLGTGLDLAYPPENRGLQERIAASGALLSEFPLGRPASRQSFPRRNRIVAGLSVAVIVIESGAAGGAMITARLAGEQGRPVFAVPGRIDQPTSAGCHQLIRDGVTLLTGIGDLLEELGFLGGRRPLPIAPRAGAGLAEARQLTGDEARVLARLAGGEILAPDALGESLGLPAARISAALLMLELKALAARQLDGRYEAIDCA